MNVSLTPEMEKFISDKIESGLYQTASEVVRDAIRLLKDEDKFREMRLEELRREVQIGIDQANRGEFAPFNETTLKAISARGHKKLAELRRKPKR